MPTDLERTEQAMMHKLPASLRFDPDSDVLAMLCVSGGNQYPLGAPALLRSLMRIAAMQNARLWVQMFNTELLEPLQPATEALLDRLVVSNVPWGGTELKNCLDATITALETEPLPNGQRPDRLVLAFNGMAADVPAPILMGQVLPTTLLLPSDTPMKKVQDEQQRWVGITVVNAANVDVAIEQLVLREALESVGDDSGSVPSARPRL